MSGHRSPEPALSRAAISDAYQERKQAKRLFLKSEILKLRRKGQLFLTARKVKKPNLKILLWVIF